MKRHTEKNPGFDTGKTAGGLGGFHDLAFSTFPMYKSEYMQSLLKIKLRASLTKAWSPVLAFLPFANAVHPGGYPWTLLAPRHPLCGSHLFIHLFIDSIRLFPYLGYCE